MHEYLISLHFAGIFSSKSHNATLLRNLNVNLTLQGFFEDGTLCLQYLFAIMLIHKTHSFFFYFYVKVGKISDNQKLQKFG